MSQNYAPQNPMVCNHSTVPHFETIGPYIFKPGRVERNKKKVRMAGRLEKSKAPFEPLSSPR